MKDKLLLQAKNNYVTMHTARDETYLEKKKGQSSSLHLSKEHPTT